MICLASRISPNYTPFDQLVNTTLIDLASQASDVLAGSKKFKTKEANFSELQTIYSLVQCTPDLSTTDCKRCLRSAIGDLPTCCSGKQGVKVLLPSCCVRYEVYPFYKVIDTAPTPAPGLPPLPPREPERIMYFLFFFFSFFLLIINNNKL